MYSKSANKGEGGYIKVGATFNAYEWGGNDFCVSVDRALSREYPDKGYAVMIDLTADKSTGVPSVAKMSIKNGDAIVNTIAGVGGLDGKTSGSVASNVAASKKVMHGYGCVCAFTPHRSVIVREV